MDILPNFTPLRPVGSKCGTALIFSIPPATITSASPALMLCAAIMIAFIPEEHTLLMVVAGTFEEMPANMAA
ncbi:MAG: Uncharacterised protein [Cryomorphaceae bacterium]|nr:MAG: Uncharacterised protein [Cryomorphaceae bacterium]